MSSSNLITTKNPKSKDKKSQQFYQLQTQISLLKHDNLQMSLIIKKLNDKITQLNQLHNLHSSTYTQELKTNTIKIQELQLVKMAQNQRINVIRQQKQQFQIQIGCLKYKLDKVNHQFNEYKISKDKEFQEYQKHMNSEIMKYQNVVNDYQESINQRLDYLKLNSQLEQQLKVKTEEQKRIIADKDRDKLQTIDFLKKEMYQKSREMRTNLLTMRRQQMATNTRLTVLQNHQLLEQLQYQSKNTDKILKRNQQLQKKVKQLTTQLQVQKQIEHELAKRNTFTKKILKNINQKNINLQKQLEQGKNNPSNNNQKSKRQNLFNKSDQILQNKSYKHKSVSFMKKSVSLNKRQITANSDEDSQLAQCMRHINLLEAEIKISLSKAQKLQKQLQHYKKLYEENQPKYQFYLKTQNDLRNLMIKFLSYTLEGKVIGEQNNVQYDISRLKNKDIEDWTKQDTQITVKMLLTFLRPYFTMKNMKAEYLKYSSKLQGKHQDYLEVEQDQQIKELLQNKNSPVKTTRKSGIIENLLPKSRNKLSIQNKKLKSVSSTALNSRVMNDSMTKDYKMQEEHVSPPKQKQFSLQKVIRDFQTKNKTKQLIKKDKKCQSHHYLTSSQGSKKHRHLVNTKSISSLYVSQQKQNKNDKSQQKSILSSPVAKSKQKQRITVNSSLKNSFTKVQDFNKIKDSSKLVRTSIREWGKKIQMQSFRAV